MYGISINFHRYYDYKAFIYSKHGIRGLEHDLCLKSNIYYGDKALTINLLSCNVNSSNPKIISNNLTYDPKKKMHHEDAQKQKLMRCTTVTICS